MSPGWDLSRRTSNVTVRYGKTFCGFYGIVRNCREKTFSFNPFFPGDMHRFYQWAGFTALFFC